MDLAVARSAVTQEGDEAGLLAAIERLELRLARMEEAMGRVTRLLDEAAPAIATVVDTADDWIRRAEERDFRLDERLHATLRAAERLTAPETVEKLEKALALADQIPGLLAMFGDVADGWVARLQEAGIDLDERGRILLQALERLTSPQALQVLRSLLENVEVVQGLLDAGVFDPEPVSIVSKAGLGLAQVGRESPQPVGLLGLLGALRDPDVQRSLGFAIRFAKRFGEALQQQSSTQRLPAAR